MPIALQVACSVLVNNANHGFNHLQISQNKTLPPAMACKALLFLGLLQHIAASPAAPRPAHVLDAEIALITPTPTLTAYGTKTRNRRGVISDITAAVESDISGILSDLGTDLPTWVASGILPQFIGLPTGSAVMSSANVSSTDLDTLPTQVLNIPVSDNVRCWRRSFSLGIASQLFHSPHS